MKAELNHPIIAILRGITSEQVIAVADRIVAEGICSVEVTLNSPNALESIRLLRDHFSTDIVVGAGTVVTVEQVQAVHEAGAQIVISPNCDEAVIAETKRLGMISIPGCMTPTECYDAIKYGADALKLFPLDVLGPHGFKGIKPTLPDVPLIGTGGIDHDSLQSFSSSGLSIIGVGSSLFNPTMSLEDVTKAAQRLVTSYSQSINPSAFN